MRNFQISATLGLTNIENISKLEPSYFVTKGSSCNIDIDVLNKAYSFDQIKQLVVIIKSPSDNLYTFKMYPESDKFAHIYGPTYNYIRLSLSSLDTASFVGNTGDIFEVEVAITISGDEQSNPYTIIERLDNFAIAESLYSKVIGE